MDFFAKIAPLRVGGFLEVHHISTKLSSDCLETSTSKGWIAITLLHQKDLSPKRTPRLVQAYQSSQCIFWYLITQTKNTFPNPNQYSTNKPHFSLIYSLQHHHVVQPQAEHPLKVMHSFHWRWLKNISGGRHWLVKSTRLKLRSPKIQRWSNKHVWNSTWKPWSTCLLQDLNKGKSQHKTPTFERILRNNPIHLNMYKNQKNATSKTIFQGACSFTGFVPPAAPRDAYSGFSVAQLPQGLVSLFFKPNISHETKIRCIFATCGEYIHRCTQWYAAWAV